MRRRVQKLVLVNVTLLPNLVKRRTVIYRGLMNG
jgi:hypothetical protein